MLSIKHSQYFFENVDNRFSENGRSNDLSNLTNSNLKRRNFFEEVVDSIIIADMAATIEKLN